MDADAPPKKTKGRGIAALLGFGLCFAAGAGAGGAGAAIGLLAFAPASVGNGGGAHAATEKAKEAAKAPVEYVEIDNAFTSNLVDTGRYLQVRIAASSDGGPAVGAAITAHKPAIVSAVLAVLGELGEPDVADRIAKDKLRAKIRAAINDVLSRKAGLAGVSEVFIVSLVIQ